MEEESAPSSSFPVAVALLEGFRLDPCPGEDLRQTFLKAMQQGGAGGLRRELRCWMRDARDVGRRNALLVFRTVACAVCNRNRDGAAREGVELLRVYCDLLEEVEDGSDFSAEKASATGGQGRVLPSLLSPAVVSGTRVSGCGFLVPLRDEGEVRRCALFCSRSQAKGKKGERWFSLMPGVALRSVRGVHGWEPERCDWRGAFCMHPPLDRGSGGGGHVAVAELTAPDGRSVLMDVHLVPHPKRQAGNVRDATGPVAAVPFVRAGARAAEEDAGGDPALKRQKVEEKEEEARRAWPRRPEGSPCEVIRRAAEQLDLSQIETLELVHRLSRSASSAPSPQEVGKMPCAPSPPPVIPAGEPGSAFFLSFQPWCPGESTLFFVARKERGQGERSCPFVSSEDVVSMREEVTGGGDSWRVVRGAGESHGRFSLAAPNVKNCASLTLVLTLPARGGTASHRVRLIACSSPGEASRQANACVGHGTRSTSADRRVVEEWQCPEVGSRVPVFKGVIEPLSTADPDPAAIFEKTFEREFAARQLDVEGDAEEWESVARALEALRWRAPQRVREEHNRMVAEEERKRRLEEERSARIRASLEEQRRLDQGLGVSHLGSSGYFPR